MQRITRAWTSLAHGAEIRPFFEMVSSYLIFNRTRNIFEVLSMKEDGYVPRAQANDLAETSGTVSNREEVAVEVCDRSAVVNEVPRCVI